MELMICSVVVVLVVTITILVSLLHILKGLQQIAKNQVGSTKMILEYLQVIVTGRNNGYQNTKNNRAE